MIFYCFQKSDSIGDYERYIEMIRDTSNEFGLEKLWTDNKERFAYELESWKFIESEPYHNV